MFKNSSTTRLLTAIVLIAAALLSACAGTTNAALNVSLGNVLNARQGSAQYPRLVTDGYNVWNEGDDGGAILVLKQIKDSNVAIGERLNPDDTDVIDGCLLKNEGGSLTITSVQGNNCSIVNIAPKVTPTKSFEEQIDAQINATPVESDQCTLAGVYCVTPTAKP